MKLDAKVHGVLMKDKDDTIIPEDEYIVFRPSDNVVPSMLCYYYRECRNRGASNELLDAITALQRRVDMWRRAHPERCIEEGMPTA